MGERWRFYSTIFSLSVCSHHTTWDVNSLFTTWSYGWVQTVWIEIAFFSLRLKTQRCCDNFDELAAGIGSSSLIVGGWLLCDDFFERFFDSSRLGALSHRRVSILYSLTRRVWPVSTFVSIRYLQSVNACWTNEPLWRSVLQFVALCRQTVTSSELRDVRNSGPCFRYCVIFFNFTIWTSRHVFDQRDMKELTRNRFAFFSEIVTASDN